MNGHIRIIREAGGVGDVVRLFPVLRELKKKYPGDKLWLYAPIRYSQLYYCSGVKHTLVPTPDVKRKRLSPLDDKLWSYLSKPVGVRKWKFDVDEYCPGFAEEVKMGQDVDRDRIECFCRAAKVWPCDPMPYLYVGTRAERSANAFFSDFNLKKYLGVVTVQPFSTDRGRDWPKHKWFELCNSLEEAGFAVIVLDVVPGRTERFSSFLRIIGQPLPHVASVIRSADLHIGPDSGLMHIASAVGTPTLVLMAAQPFHIVCKHYKKAVLISPPLGAIGPCKSWPCLWHRPMQCVPYVSKRPCPILQRIQVVDVLKAAVDVILECGKISLASLDQRLELLHQRTPVCSQPH